MRTVEERRADAMTYYGLTALSPYGVLSSLLCETLTYIIDECGYQDCADIAVAVVVRDLHRVRNMDTDLANICCQLTVFENQCEVVGCRKHKNKDIGQGSTFLGVCERHFGWEQAKVSGLGWDMVWE